MQHPISHGLEPQGSSLHQVQQLYSSVHVPGTWTSYEYRLAPLFGPVYSADAGSGMICKVSTAISRSNNGFLCFIYFYPYFIGLGPKLKELRTGEGKYTKPESADIRAVWKDRNQYPRFPIEDQSSPGYDPVPVPFRNNQMYSDFHAFYN